MGIKRNSVCDCNETGRVALNFIRKKFIFFCFVSFKTIFRVLLPGGGTWFNQSHGYAVAGSHIFNIAQEINDNGTYLPLFGTCLGFELLLYVSNENQEYRTFCSSERQSLPLEFSKGERITSRILTFLMAENILLTYRFSEKSSIWIGT